MQNENKKIISSKYKRLIGDTLIFALGSLGSKIVLFFMVPLYTNCLTTAEYGTSDLVFTVAQLLIPFVSLVIFDAVLRFGLSSDVDEKNVLKSSFVVIIIGSIITIAITPLVDIYSPLSKWKWYLCTYVILTMIGNVELNYLKLIDKNKEYALSSIFHAAILAAANIILLSKLNWGIKGYLTSTIVGSAFTVLFAFFAGKIVVAFRAGKVDRTLLKNMIIFSSPLILNNISWWVIQSSDKIMIEAMVGASALGLYTAATKIPSLINVIISIFSQAWGISSIREFESSNDNNFYSYVFLSYSVIGFGATIFISTIVKPFMAMYVSDTFSEAWKFVPILLVSASFSVVASYFGSLYGALKKSVNSMLSTLCAAVVNIVINFLCIPCVGVWGAIIGTVTAYCVLALYRMVDVLRCINFDPKWKLFAINSVLVLMQAILVSLNFHSLITSIITICLFSFINKKTIFQIAKMLLNFIRRN